MATKYIVIRAASTVYETITWIADQRCISCIGILRSETYSNTSNVWIASVALDLTDIILTRTISCLEKVRDNYSILRIQKVVAINE